MTRTGYVRGRTLVLLLALVAGLIGVPALQLSASSSSASSPPAGTPRPPTRGHTSKAPRRATLGHTPTARTQVDRDLVALLFSGLVRVGPGGTLVPDLAERWSVDATGKT